MEIKSALMTSATTLDNTGQPIQRAGADATPLDYGAGPRPADQGVQPGPGLRLSGHRLDPLWLRHRSSSSSSTDPSFCAVLRIGRPEQPQLPGIAVGSLAGTKTVTRTVTNISDRGERYVASVKAPPGSHRDGQAEQHDGASGRVGVLHGHPDPDHGDSRRLGVRVADLDRWPRPRRDPAPSPSNRSRPPRPRDFTVTGPRHDVGHGHPGLRAQ